MNLGITFDEFPNAFSMPDGPPKISYPFKGNSVPGKYPWFIFDPTSGTYVSVPVGTGFNNNPANNNATAFVIEQIFIVRAANYTPLLLNTAYDDAWSLGWNGPEDLSTAILVTEGRLEMMAGGLGRVRRTFANIPPSWNSFESFTFNFRD